MSELESQRVDLAIDRIQSDVRDPDRGRQKAFSVAEKLASRELIDDGNIRFRDGAEFDLEEFNLQVDHLRRARKVAEVLEDEYAVNLGHGKFAQAATTAGQLNSYVSIVIASNNLIQASEALLNEHEEENNVEDIPEETYDEFYRASSVFILECFLLVTPINYQIAWQGTRYLNNQYLYYLRNFGDHGMALYRVVLSETHYILRGVIPSALRQSVDTFASYLVWVTTSSIEILNDHGEVTGRNGRQKIEQVVTEFIEFTKDTYQVSESVINELSFRDVYSDILTQLSDLVDFQLPSVDDFKTPF